MSNTACAVTVGIALGGARIGGVTPPIILTVDDDPEVTRALARDLRQRYGEESPLSGGESPAASCGRGSSPSRARG
jgi:hypothetical protein